VAEYEGKELTFRQMQRAVDRITDQYRLKGYVTSRAYMPPQTIEDGVLLIRVVEGKLGDVQIKGNMHFKTGLIRKKMDVRPAGYFDYSALQRSLVYINEHPDRMAKAVLVPGAKPGTTDVVIEVEDRLPLHAGFEYDNWGSRYIDRSRYALVLEHNNVTGNDDKMYFKGQLAENQQLRLGQVRYAYPLTPTLEVGAHALFSKVRSGDEFAAFDAEGSAEFYGVFGSKRLIQNDRLDVRANFGFDYKSIRDDFAGVELSSDEVRVLRGGVDVDFSDRWGRTILTAEVNQGLSGIMGAMEDKDPRASRTGAGAKFTKGVFNLFRLQPMPYETSLLWKNTAQYTNHRLIAAEQFQIGGATSVRGYPPAEFSGDDGLYTSLELSIPWYFLSRTARVPFYSKDRLYDALRFVVFWDWACIGRTAPAAGEDKRETLRGAGFGMRRNLSEHLDFRVEVGYPLGGPTPSDGDHMHPWVEFSYKF
jgi:hemolysin activation/secretion protein